MAAATDGFFFITGGASGLGLATAAALLVRKRACHVVIADQSEERVAEAMKQLGEEVGAPGRLSFVQLDVTDADAVDAAISSSAERYGRFIAAVNCAGVGAAAKTLSRGEPHDLELFQFIMRVNVEGSFNVCRFAAKVMAKQRPDGHGCRGLLINTASIAAFEGQRGQLAYAASKGALVSMALPMARDLAKYGIRVVTIAPGIFDTPLMASASERVRASLLSDVIAPKRFGKPYEYASAVLTLLDNAYFNATVLRLDGGIRMSNL
eukprot:PLAT9261.1.p1 GENE.PLAT9261.1~~PLAT9261.1.p1  ORF type:complete len:276 (+),score=74.86 PLAT9261.1:35-829(+)